MRRLRVEPEPVGDQLLDRLGRRGGVPRPRSARAVAGPALPRLGAPYDWDVLIPEDDDSERESPEEEALQAELHETLSEMLRTPGMQPGEAARLIRRRFGVAGIYVEDGSAVAWPLRRLRD